MATGQGTTWVLVTDARQARVLEVEDAGLPPAGVDPVTGEVGDVVDGEVVE